MFCMYFPPICGLSFHSHNSAFLRAEVLSFDVVQHTIYKNLMDGAFAVLSKKSLPNHRSQKFSLFSSRCIIVLDFTFRSKIHFELIFEINRCYEI